jgi:hypothetical protein
VGALLPRGGEEGLEPLAHDLVEERLLGLPAPVTCERRAGRTGMALPAFGAVRGDGHPSPHRKGRASGRA